MASPGTPSTPRYDSASSGPLLLAITVAGGTMAYADPVRFDNDGSFEWRDGVYLDITRSAQQQTGLDAGQASFLYSRILSSCCEPDENHYVTGSTPDAQIAGEYVTEVEAAGSLVPDDFVNGGGPWENMLAFGYYYQLGLGFATEFNKGPVGVPGNVGYIAARFDIAGSTHYGWMGLTLTRYNSLGTWVFNLFAWGYETDPNTAIAAGAVPAPGAALALLAFGAAAGATRGRRA